MSSSAGMIVATVFSDESDYRAYLDYLATFAHRFGCWIHAYCLMTNHLHLFLTPHTSDACTQMMRHIGQHYVQRVNKRLGRSGTLWEGRFHSCLVPSERYALTCYRYIELNPVEAKMVSRPIDYRWSSYALNTRGDSLGFLTPHGAYKALAVDPITRCAAYAALFDSPLDSRQLDEIRKATRGGYAVGVTRKRPGRPPHAAMRKIGSVPN